jgi:N-methylhydantoinase A
MTLDTQMAEKSLEKVSSTLGSTINQTALGTISVLNNNMASAIRSRTIQKGIDPRDFSLCAFGGGGPLQAVGVAEILGIKEVIIPQNPGIMCAFGLLTSRIEYHSVRTLLMTKTQFNLSFLSETLTEMKDDLISIFERDKADTKLISFEAFTDLRYVGQGYELKVPLNSDMLKPEHLEEVWDAFHKQHKQEYGHNFTSADIEMVSVKLKAHIKKENPYEELSFESSFDEYSGRSDLTMKEVEFSVEGKPQRFDTEIIRRNNLAGGIQKMGPNVVYQQDSTTVVPPGWTMSVDDDLSLRLRKLDNNNE